MTGGPPQRTDERTVRGDWHDIGAIGALLLLGSLAFLRLMAIPAFEDEGTQLRLIWRMVQAGEWLQPLGYGKPLEAWPMAPLLRLRPHPLTLIRSLHVLAGMLGAVLTYGLARQLSSRRAALVCGILFAFCPFVVYLQRLALSEVLLCAAGLAVLLCVVKFIQSPTWPRTVTLAMTMVLAAFCKLPVGFFFLSSMPLAYLFLDADHREAFRRPPFVLQALAALTPATLLAIAVATVAILRVRHGQTLGFGLDDLLTVGLGPRGTIAAAIGVPRPTLLGELSAQLSWPVVVIFVLGLGASVFIEDWRVRWLLTAGLIPLLAIGLLPTFWFSRYLLFTLPPLIIAAVAGWCGLVARAGRFGWPAGLGVLATCLVLMGHQSARLILDPLTANWSPTDRFQYFEGWPSGYGYPEAAQYIREASDAPPTIYSLDDHSAYQLRNYMPVSWNDRITPVDYAPDGSALASNQARLDNLLARSPAWIVISVPLLERYLTSSFGPAVLQRIRVRQIALFNKPGLHAELAIYEITRRAPL